MKNDVISGIGNSENLTVQKSLPLFSLWKSDYSLLEFKMLDLYLARINSHNPNCRTVKFYKGELENLFGVKQIKPIALTEHLHKLLSPVKINDKSNKRGFCLINLFEKAECYLTDEGLWEISMVCTESAMTYFFNVEHLGYLRYKLRCVSNLSSRYSYILFCYLESNRAFRTSWNVSVDDLRKILDCDNEKYCNDFKYFNRDVLKKSFNEICNNTECSFAYFPNMVGKKAVSIRFVLQPLTKQEIDTFNSVDFIEWPGSEASLLDQDDIDDVYSSSSLWFDAIKDFNFSLEQLDEIKELLFLVPDFRMPADPTCCDSIDIRRFHYLSNIVSQIKRINSATPIKNKFAYLRKIIRNDVYSEA